jgi:hypothetical protein
MDDELGVITSALRGQGSRALDLNRNLRQGLNFVERSKLIGSLRIHQKFIPLSTSPEIGSPPNFGGLWSLRSEVRKIFPKDGGANQGLRGD